MRGHLSGDFTTYGGSLRTGPRLPLSVLSLSAGGSLGMRWRQIPNYSTHDALVHGTFGGWARAEANVFCDWVPFVGFDLEAVGQSNQLTSTEDVYTRIQFGVAYQPSSRCREQRSHPVGLQAAAE